ncbi:MAG TPA: Ig-like domain-containing protein [Kofleriaceae bacterium]|nr:Ig-like domain-containing protein [Kofleriaceae bacterium]
MKLGVMGAVLLVPSIAAADARLFMNAAGEANDLDFVGESRGDGLVMARQVLPAPDQPIVNGLSDGPKQAVLAQSKIIYLNKNGVTLSPGNNDSRTNRSTIVTQTTSIPAWNVTAANWAAVVSCTKDLFARFDVTVVDTDPGNVPHIEAVFGGTPTQVGLPNNVAGVSPFTTDCSIIENSVVFTFAGAFQLTSRDACEIMAQEIAHSYGLDHELLASDPMTYLQYTGNRAFQDQTASCGEDVQRACGINGSTCRANQNSVTLLKERLGTAGDLTAPMLTWQSPSDGATVPPGFEVHASGTDNVAVTGATLKIDGTQVDMKTGAGPFVFVTSATLPEGAHQIVIEITDGKNLQTQTRSVTVKKGAPPPDPGGGSGSGSGTGGGGSDDLNNGDIVGGCAAGGGQAGMLFGLALVFGLARRRRR